MDNPNTFGLSLAKVDYAFFVEGKQVVAGAPRKGIELKARDSSELVFPANVKFADIVPAVETFLTKDAATFKVQGSVGIDTPIGVISFPLEKEGTFEMPKIPNVQFESPRITNVSLTGATVEFPLTITNRNSFPLPIAGIAGDLKVAGASVGTLSTGDLGMLDGRGTRQVTLPAAHQLRARRLRRLRRCARAAMPRSPGWRASPLARRACRSTSASSLQFRKLSPGSGQSVRFTLRRALCHARPAFTSSVERAAPEERHDEADVGGERADARWTGLLSHRDPARPS